jgi:hypothetical protein
MDTLPRNRPTSSPRISLTAEEREVILTWNDAERRWHVFSDSLVLRGAIQEMVARLGIVPVALGAGIAFDLPPGRGIALPGIPPLTSNGKSLPVAGSRKAVGANRGS